ncbi:hypothetical protein KOW79_017668 [Hemibagrus wyckioides]|uniref:Uncharacterized protein n=1 Tax=Hemibagrus wyckioides TaxID=337641 RepID=A0A9D3NB37_9TELE|nr:hypothetical protein KOW79_017668 [Hemibagrus wyckioides]
MNLWPCRCPNGSRTRFPPFKDVADAPAYCNWKQTLRNLEWTHRCPPHADAHGLSWIVLKKGGIIDMVEITQIENLLLSA